MHKQQPRTPNCFRVALFSTLVIATSACGPGSQVETSEVEPSKTVKSGPVLMGGQVVEAEYALNDEGYAIVEGDIIVEPVNANAQAKSEQELATRTGFLWPVVSGYVTVPYALGAGLSSEAKKAVTIAMSRWTAAMNIKFVARSTQSDYVSFEPSTGCSSSIGKVGGKQVIQLAPACYSTGAIHEIGHALGAFHEQTRVDRDNFVTINTANVMSAMIHNFNKYSLTYVGTDNGPYDFRSIMHYDSFAFSVAPGDVNKPTIVQKGNNKIITRNIALSTNDICYMKKRYFPTTVCNGVSSCASTVTQNETRATAFDISAYNGVQAEVKLCRSDISAPDVDWFKFNVPSGTTIKINGEVDFMAMALLEGDTVVVNGAVADWQLTDDAFTYTTTKAGFVYLAAQGGDQAYKLKVSW